MVMIRHLKRFARPILATILLAMTHGPWAVAQGVDPSPEQLAIFQGLSPEQQESVLRQMSERESGTGGATDRQVTTSDRNARPVRPTDSARRGSDVQGGELAEPRIPVFKAEDTLLVQIDLPQAFRQPPQQNQVNPLAQAPGQLQQPQARMPVEPLPVEPEEIDEREQTKREELRDLIRSRNPYRLDRNGQLNLPGFPPIALGGLTEQQATQRLAEEPGIRGTTVRIVRLPVNRIGLEGLKRFGYDLFEEPSSAFSPVTDAPVPANYTVGPGDELNVQLFGGQNRNLRLTVARDGTVSFPGLGPISVTGMTFARAKDAIESRVSEQMIGVRANVAMGDLRAIRVFVLGETRQPGSYSVSGMATMTTALFASGGVKPIGSLRNIQLKRRGTVVRSLDLYDLLIAGDTSDDSQLQPGDVIFIPPAGSTVSIDGEVQRPAIYELSGEATVSDVLRMAGGLTAEADPGRASLTRIDPESRRVVMEIDLRNGTRASQALRNGDVLRVSRLRPQVDLGVTLNGFVHRPGPVAWREGLRLTDVIGSADELQSNADQQYILIRRETGRDRRLSVLSADLNRALAAPGSDADVRLMPRDQIFVFELASGRERIIKPILDEILLQSALDRPTEVVRVAGRVKVPGEYPLEPGMRVSDLIRAGGNLQAAAYGGKAELARYRVGESGTRQTELVEVDLAAVRSGDREADLLLGPFDSLLVKETPNWSDAGTVELTGEVRFPGVYPLRRGETLREVLNRAGGLTSLSFPEGSVFTRKELKEREQKQVDMLVDRMQTDIATLSIQAAAANQSGASQALLAGQTMLAQLRQAKAVGRLVIDLKEIIAGTGGAAGDVVLKDGDWLIVPKQKQEVTVIGEVQSVTSHFYGPTLDRDDYIAMSGGLTRKADASQIYVVRADGSVVTQRGSLFRRTHQIAMRPGDTIVVPLDTERMPQLPFWQAVTQIIFNLAIAVSAINSF